MGKPIILTVDDERQVLNAIYRDLRQQFRKDYRIMKAGSGAEALKTIRELNKRGDPIALFLSDQRMPEMDGTEYLAEASKIYPGTKKILLTAYADTEAAIRSINEIGLDHYLMKPWDPPEVNLYPVIEDLLDTWESENPPAYDGIRVVGAMWSGACHDAKDFLARNRIPFQWLDIEKDPAAAVLVDDPSKLPVVFFPDGREMIQPTRKALAEAIGMKTQAEGKHYEFAIIGAGPAGLAAAVYGPAEGIQTLLIEKDAAGGQAGTSSRIENYLGFPKGLSGGDLARRAMAQVTRLGTEVLLPQEVTDIRVEDPYKILTFADGSEVTCYALAICTGMSVRTLNAPGMERLTGAGVYYGAALTEAANFKDKPVYVVGGANSAGQGALWFSRYASHVYVLVRGYGLEKSMSRYLIDRIDAHPTMSVMNHTEVHEVMGEDRLEKIRLHNNQTKEDEIVEAAAMFVFIGSRPHSDLVKDLVEIDAKGFIKTGADLVVEGKRPKGWKLPRDPTLLETSIPGIFAVGDVRSGSSKRVAAATGEGSVAVFFVYRHIHGS